MKHPSAASEVTVAIATKKPILSQAVIRALVFRAAEVAKLKHAFAVNVRLVGPARSRALNRQWRGKDTPTNVLSFAAREGTMPTVSAPVEDLGDIVICPAVIVKEAPRFGVTARDHARRLVVHGFLHLLGHDHAEDADAAAMETLEQKIIKSI